jgi:amino acid transporter
MIPTTVDNRGGDAGLNTADDNPGFPPPDVYLLQRDQNSDDSLTSHEHSNSEGVISDRQPRSLTFIHGLAIVVGLQIGSGIFSAPAAVRSHVSSTGLAMLAWIVAGIIAATGAASFATLGRLVPLNGGIQEYLRFLYGDLFGFLFAWMWIFVSRPLALGMVSLVFSEYLFKAILFEQTIPTWVFKVSAILAVAAITWLNSMGTRIGTGMGNIFLSLKVFGLCSIPIAGMIVFLSGSDSSQESAPGNPQVHHTVTEARGSIISPSSFSEIWVSFGGFGESIYAAAFATGGWESVSNASNSCLAGNFSQCSARLRWWRNSRP